MKQCTSVGLSGFALPDCINPPTFRLLTDAENQGSCVYLPEGGGRVYLLVSCKLVNSIFWSSALLTSSMVALQDVNRPR